MGITFHIKIIINVSTGFSLIDLRNNKFVSPLMLTSMSSDDFNSTAFLGLCYQVFLIPYTYVNLFSSSSLSINARYNFIAGEYHISAVGIVLGGSHRQCTYLVVKGGSQCEILLNNRQISATKSSYAFGQYAIQVSAVAHLTTTVTISSSLDHHIITKVACKPQRSGSKRVELYLSTALCHQNSHGILGTYIHSMSNMMQEKNGIHVHENLCKNPQSI